MRLSFALSLGLLAAAAQPAAADTLAVPSQFATIQAAIDAAVPGDTVLVADGVFAGPGNRDLSFGGKAIIVRSEHGPTHTIIDAQGTPTEPHRGFVFEQQETRGAVLHGFTIKNGDTFPGAIADTFNGGAIVIRSASPTIRDCHFVENSSGCWGGAVYSGPTGDLGGPAAPLIEGCLFVGNSTGDDGGGFFTWGFGDSEQAVIRNSVFLGNSAAVTGGAVAEFGGANLRLENVTIVGNTSSFGTGAFLGSATMTNSIVWGNGSGSIEFWNAAEVTYSNVQGGAPGVGNVDVDPLFAPDGFHLLPISPLVNRGSPVAAGGTDIDGQPRLLGRRTDIGADEVRPLGTTEVVGSGVHP